MNKKLKLKNPLHPNLDKKESAAIQGMCDRMAKLFFQLLPMTLNVITVNVIIRLF